MEQKKQWSEMTTQERRGLSDAYLINLTTLKCNPCSQKFSELNERYRNQDGEVFQVIKITKDESRDIIFFYSIKI